MPGPGHMQSQDSGRGRAGAVGALTLRAGPQALLSAAESPRQCRVGKQTSGPWRQLGVELSLEIPPLCWLCQPKEHPRMPAALTNSTPFDTRVRKCVSR